MNQIDPPYVRILRLRSVMAPQQPLRVAEPNHESTVDRHGCWWPRRAQNTRYAREAHDMRSMWVLIRRGDKLHSVEGTYVGAAVVSRRGYGTDVSRI